MKLALVLLPLCVSIAKAETKAPVVPNKAPAPEVTVKPTRLPTLANVAYGSHERQVLDFYKAKSSKPTPLLFFIHGGGWVKGDKANPGELAPCLAAGISVVSINYRYSWQAQLAGVMPPVEWPLADAARALQFVRSKAAEWNIDKQRIGASGGSAGACSSLYLAFHDDLADPQSSDPVARESTRLFCAAVNGAQTSLDPLQLKEWTPNSRYGGHAFGFMDPNDLGSRDKSFAEFYEKRESVLKWIKQYSPYEHVSRDDPPVYLIYTAAPGIGLEQRDPTHTANYGIKLQEHCRAIGTVCELVYPTAPEVKHKSMSEFLIDVLKR
ncbi:MAG: alpha/beta hydrolase fold domain-containing protein [Verrucomicrobia bacterium]|nr:alpha/beta hydrolase fold domain-containing protein [Verrucomicrobiota bacterium]